MKTVILVAALALGGCANSYSVSAVHFSHPTETEMDSTLNGVEVAAEWTRGPVFVEGSATYALSRTNMYGGPLSTTVKVGMRFGGAK